jgi:hypothetical protein
VEICRRLKSEKTKNAKQKTQRRKDARVQRGRGKKEKVKRRKWEKEVKAERGDGRWKMGKRGIDDLCLPLRLCTFAFHSHFAFHAILSASRRPESFYTLLTLSQKQGNTGKHRGTETTE